MKKGFTLIELLVVIGIIGIISTAVIWNGVSSRRIASVGLSAEEAFFKLRELQNQSLVAEAVAGFVPCGFGIHYDVSNDAGFVIFTESPTAVGNDCIDSGASQNIDRVYGGFGDEASETFTISAASHVQIAGLFEDIYFEPPDGVVYLNGTTTVSTSTLITFCLRNNCSGLNRSVRVNLGGNIETE